MDEAERTAAVEHLVEEIATKAAAKAVLDAGRIHRRRLVSHAAIAAFVTALIVCVPLILVTNGQRTDDSRAHARYNCHTLTVVAGSFESFLRSDAKLRRDLQNYGIRQRREIAEGFAKVIGKDLLNSLQSRSDLLDRHAQHYWLKVLAPRLEKLANINCAAAIR